MYVHVGLGWIGKWIGRRLNIVGKEMVGTSGRDVTGQPSPEDLKGMRQIIERNLQSLLLQWLLQWDRRHNLRSLIVHKTKE